MDYETERIAPQRVSWFNALLLVLITLSVVPPNGFAQREEIPQRPWQTEFWCFVGSPANSGSCERYQSVCEGLRQIRFDRGVTAQLTCHRQREVWCLEHLFAYEGVDERQLLGCFPSREGLVSEIRRLQAINRELPMARRWRGLTPFRYVVR